MSEPSLGPCCACEGTRRVRNILMLPKRSPIAGRGWGCFQCGLSADGAMAVLCDRCLRTSAEPRFACRGYPGVDGRVPIGDLVGDHRHDMSKHPGERTCRVCGCTDDFGCDVGCEWVEEDLCSACVEDA